MHNNAINFTDYQNTNPYNLHSDNFIELLFKQALNNGWGSISLITLIHCYAYLSLGKIKELFEYFNAKISEHGKTFVENIAEKIKNYILCYITLFCEYIKVNLQTFYEYVYRYGNDLYIKYKTKKTREEIEREEKEAKEQEEKLKKQQELDNTIDNKSENIFTYEINVDNMTDIMAICNSVLSLRDKIIINNKSFRKDSSSEKATECIAIPNLIEWPIKTPEGKDVLVRLQQHVNLKLDYESDAQYEVLKKCVTSSKGKDHKVEITVAAFARLIDEWYNKAPVTLKQLDAFKWEYTVPSNNKKYYCDPYNISANKSLSRLFCLFYLINDVDNIKSLFYFLSSNDKQFNFQGITYTCIDPPGPVSLLWIEDSDKDNWFTEYNKFRPSYVKQHNSSITEDELKINNEYFAGSSLAAVFSQSNVTGLTVSFIDKSKILSVYDLSIIARNWMIKQIHEYYNQQNKRVDNRISIYKIKVNYMVEQVTVTNPKYTEWLVKNGLEDDNNEDTRADKEKEKEKEKDKENKDKENKDKENKENKDKENKENKHKENKENKENKNKENKDKEKDKNSKHKKETDSKSKDKDKEIREGDSDDNSSDNEIKDHLEGARKTKQKIKKQKFQMWPNLNNYDSYASSPWMNYSDIPVAPPKTITEDKYTPEIECTLIKSDKKPLEYLYLPEDVNDKLLNYLKTFKESRSQYEKYGFPYKGGILLSGVPGCGKSTTILATATFLDKDIYYLDLGLIKTNTELKLCMDYIKGSSKNGGVVIFEDIDCMTDIVLQRFSSESDDTPDKKSLNTILSSVDKNKNTEDKLSLSFLLNILDGTLSPENIIFIMTTNFPDKLDKALTRPGRIDIDIKLRKCSRYQVSKVFKDLYERVLPEELLNLFEEDKYTTAEVILHLFYNKFNKKIKDEEVLKPFLLL